LFAALAVEVRAYCGFEVEEGGDVPASHKRFAAGYACRHRLFAAEMMEGDVDCLQVVPRPKDVGTRFGWALVGGRE
jgi:hypothetical protein